MVKQIRIYTDMIPAISTLSGMLPVLAWGRAIRTVTPYGQYLTSICWGDDDIISDQIWLGHHSSARDRIWLKTLARLRPAMSQCSPNVLHQMQTYSILRREDDIWPMTCVSQTTLHPWSTVSVISIIKALPYQCLVGQIRTEYQKCIIIKNDYPGIFLWCHMG